MEASSSISFKPSPIVLGRMQVGGKISLVIAAIAIACLTFNLHVHASAGCIASCASLSAAALVLGLYLTVAGKKKGVGAFDHQRIIQKEMILKAFMWTSLALSLIFGGNLAAAIIEKGSIGCLATCAAIMSATFVLGICLAYERSRKFNQVERTIVTISSFATQQKVQLENTVYLDAQGKRIQPAGVTSVGTLKPGQIQKFAAINRALEQEERFSEGRFAEILNENDISDEDEVETLWSTYKRQYEDLLALHNTPHYQFLLKDEKSLRDQPRGFHFREDAVEVIDQIREGDQFFVRRRILNKATNEMTTQLGLPYDHPLPSIRSHFERRDSFQ